MYILWNSCGERHVARVKESLFLCGNVFLYKEGFVADIKVDVCLV